MRKRKGTVVSNKMEKTVVVSINTYKQHPLYKKRYLQTKRVLAHTEKSLKTGDVVEIVESRPLSKRKRWVVL